MTTHLHSLLRFSVSGLPLFACRPSWLARLQLSVCFYYLLFLDERFLGKLLMVSIILGFKFIVIQFITFNVGSGLLAILLWQ